MTSSSRALAQMDRYNCGSACNLGYLPTLSKLRCEKEEANTRIASSPGGIVIATPLYNHPAGPPWSVTNRSSRALQNGGGLEASFSVRKRSTGASTRRALYQALETDNGRTGAPHSSKRHSSCTGDDDDDKVTPLASFHTKRIKEERTNTCRYVAIKFPPIGSYARNSVTADLRGERRSGVNDVAL